MLLENIKEPRDLRAHPVTDLKQVADELRAETISAVSVTGGHLGAGLGVVELTVALHYVFDTPRDRLIWDVGHQAYPHKILTGAARPHPHAAPGRRPVRLHQARGERIRPLRRRAFLDLDFGRPRHGGGARSAGRDAQRRRGDRRRRDVGRHGLRGDEQCRRDGFAPDRHPQRQRHVDRAAGRRDVGLSRAARFRAAPICSLREIGKQLAKRLPKFVEQQAARGGGICARLRDRRHAVRGARLLLRRADRRAQSRPPAAGAEERARRQGRADPRPRRDAEGQGLRAGRGLRATSITASSSSTSPPARRPRPRRTRRPTPRCSAKAWSRRRRRTTASSRSPPRCRPAPASTSSARRSRRAPSTSASPSSMRVTFAAGLADRGLQAVLRDLFDLPAARLRPGRPRRRDPEPAGALRHRPRRPRRRRRADPCRLVRYRLSRLPARLRDDGGGGRGRTRPHGRDRGRDRRPAVGASAIRAATASASTCRKSACRSRSARAASSAKAARSRSCRSARGLPECLKAAEELAAHGLSTTVADARFAKPLDVDLILRLAREHEVLITVEEGSIGGFGAHVLQTLAEARRARARPQGALPWCCPTSSSIRTRRRRCMPRPGSTANGIVAKVFEALGKDVRAHDNCQAWSDVKPDRNTPHATGPLSRQSAHRGVILAQPRGFCAGVVRAIEIVERALQKYGAPVYVRHEIVHNKHVVESLKAKGARFVESCRRCRENAVTIFSAHGVAPSVEEEAADRASCRCSTRPARWSPRSTTRASAMSARAARSS